MPEPRVFRAGDPEPTDVAEVQHTSSQRFQACVTVELVAGVEVSRSQCWTAGDGDPLDWSDLTRRLGSCTLTEVVDPDQGGLTGSSVIVEGTRPASQDRRDGTNTPPPVSQADQDPAEGLSGELRATLAAYLDRVLLTEAWEESGEEIADVVLRMASEAGWRPPGDVEWGYLRAGELGLAKDYTRKASEAVARSGGTYPGWVTVQRVAPGPWTAVTE
ncbi:MAG: hypothetical protein JWQ81_8578 [Amycolatopsis sp.]|uniref:hypothetical protein n=1 Tax=Amycolatopsis sp. TaxID=37632 RepID=UPI002618407C|nr:hypothetical protein [Amycolatopsis sp.]MCU1687839.1 hypothetical protein [Amycolatopsis sp.]